MSAGAEALARSLLTRLWAARPIGRLRCNFAAFLESGGRAKKSERAA